MQLQESYRIELKRELTDSLEKEVVAFLNNKEGGKLYIGVEDNGDVFGIENPDDIQLKIKDRIKNNISPSALGLFDVILEEEDGKSFIQVNIAGGLDKPYYIKSMGMSERGCFMRVGSSTERMPQRKIDELYERRTRVSLRKIKSSRQDLKFEQLKIYYQERKLTLNDQFASNLELLTDESDYNYIAYLLSDNNAFSIRVAKYSGKDRIDVIENKELGYCSIVKAAKQVLDKIDVENRIQTKIKSKDADNIPLWNPIAIKEAVINAFVHNDYASEASPKFEIFTDRIEITSAGGLVLGLSQDEFFNGFSIPRNKELIRIFKDLDMMEFLGSGLPRILKHYSTDSFNFSDNFLRVVFPSITTQKTTQKDENRTSTEQVPNKYRTSTEQVSNKIINMILIVNGEMSRSEIQEKIGLKQRVNFIQNHLNPAIENGYIALKYPNAPRNPKQKYYLTEKGKELADEIKKNMGNDE